MALLAPVLGNAEALPNLAPLAPLPGNAREGAGMRELGSTYGVGTMSCSRSNFVLNQRLRSRTRNASQIPLNLDLVRNQVRPNLLYKTLSKCQVLQACPQLKRCLVPVTRRSL